MLAREPEDPAAILDEEFDRRYHEKPSFRIAAGGLAIRYDCRIERPHPTVSWNHLAAEWQVGEGASPRRDATRNMRRVGQEINGRAMPICR